MLPQVPPGGSSRRAAVSALWSNTAEPGKGLAVFNRSAHSAGPGTGPRAEGNEKREEGEGLMGRGQRAEGRVKREG